MNATLTHDMSVLSLITGASIPVQLVMAMLLLASLFSWYYIFLKIFTLRRAAQQTADFERQFWSGADLNELYQRAVNARESAGTLERIFEAGFREFTKHRRQPGADVGALMDSTRRAMRATYQREMDKLESSLSFLASVGSVSPYIAAMNSSCTRSEGSSSRMAISSRITPRSASTSSARSSGEVMWPTTAARCC